MRSRVAVLLAMVPAAMVWQPMHSYGAEAYSQTVNLTGAQVVPGPADPDGAGGVFYRASAKSGRFCYFENSGNIATPLSAFDLHRGSRGANGELVVQLHGPSHDPSVSDCVDLGRNLVRDIIKNPSDYYFDVHNAEYPAGALRGQLG